MTKSNKFSQLMSDTKHLETLTNEMEKEKKTEYGKDTRYWTPSVDKAGNGYAIIRFLPVSEKDWGKLTKGYVKYFSHGFKGPLGQWYIENSRTTLGEADPVSEYNSALWATENEEKREIARKQKRKLSYVSNILVVKDEKQPENEGKVFLFKYGPKIYEKLEEATKPPFPDSPKFNPFHFLEGANFKLKIRNGDGGFRSYNSSEFDKPTPLCDGDEDKLNDIWEQEHSLLDEIAPSKFKSYDELKKRMETVLGTVVATSKSGAVPKDGLDDEDDPFETDRPVPTPKQKSKPVLVQKPEPEADDTGDAAMALFKKLASE